MSCLKNRFADLGSLIDKLSGQYADIADKSFKKLDREESSASPTTRQGIWPLFRRRIWTDAP